MDVNLLYFTSLAFKIILALLIGFVTTLYFVSSWNHNHWKKKGIYFQKPYPFVGNLTFLMRKSFTTYLSEISKKFCGVDYFGAYFFHKPVLIIQSPKIMQRILVTESDKFRNRYSYTGENDPIGKLGLFLVKDPLWSDIRKEMSPMFTTSRLRGICRTLNANAEDLVKYIEKNYIRDSKPVHLKETFLRYTTDTVGYTVYGLSTSAFNDEDSPLWFITKHMVNFSLWRGFEFTMIFLVPDVANLLRSNFFSKKATDYIKKLYKAVVEERRRSGKYEDKDLISHFLRLEERLNIPDHLEFDDVVSAQTGVFILGSLETSTSTMTFCVNELAYNQDIQERLYQEIKTAKEKYGKEILDYEELIEMKYLTACILETLRKYPPVAQLDRISKAPFELDGKIIEKGTPVILSVVSIHQNEKYYPNPSKWDPERFTGVDENSNRQFTFLPFGDGPRFCVGKRYGMLQVRAALAQVLAKYRLEPGLDPYEIPSDPYSILLAPLNGGSVKFILRK